MSTPATTEASNNPMASSNKKKPTVIILIGMAGSGKTTVMQRLNAHVRSISKKPYIINLDPAVTHLPYTPNIDIRDTINYKEVMKQYSLGPNGAIITSLNLFTTKFDQVLSFLEKRSEDLDYILIDTPGQIEIFTWSASGSIITETLAAGYPTMIAYVVDTPRSKNASTFMSNMLYACSIIYKSHLPLLLLFNKTDVLSHQFALTWMTDFTSFQSALHAHSSTSSSGEDSYMNSLVQSMSLVLEEFYENFEVCGVSAVTGQGFDEFLQKVEKGREEYEREYLPTLNALIESRQNKESKRQQENLQTLMKDLDLNDESEPKSTENLAKEEESDDGEVEDVDVHIEDPNTKKMEDMSFRRFVGK
ncbi:hypothetical protein BKA69DRAFT_1123622 [Paraphysoderma sedebokerense]|nr:hypothetical protein BKA69DRAFT_1123622 [Paraphysoderma sedebokerense]